MVNTSSTNSRHIPVMLLESLENLKIKNNGIYVDGTLGLGGHSDKILEKIETCSITVVALLFDHTWWNINFEQLFINDSNISLINGGDSILYLHEFSTKTLLKGTNFQELLELFFNKI